MKTQITIKSVAPLMVAAAVLTVNTMQAGAPRAFAELPKNATFLASPRYLEEHPELLRARSSGEQFPALKTDRLAKLTENTALANSPRFREVHSELRWATPSLERSMAQNVSARARLSKLTENKAFAASPRFLEEHPELLRGQPAFERATLK